ncbi:MAG: penicillin-binding protein 2 [Alphaproteobacteria bacterium]|nr:penicillin-binding protein 2 [Alphaproteobacteria bacterium]
MAGLQLAGLGVLGTRLAWLQIAQGGRYKTLSDKNRINVRLLPPSRGQIVDRFGVPLAVNVQNYRVLVVPEQTEDLEQSLHHLQEYITVDDKTIARVLREAKRTQKFLPIKIRDDLEWEEVARVEVNLPDLPGMMIDSGSIRNYPYGEATAHIVGYVGAASEKEVGTDPLLTLPGFKIGKSGIEKTFDLALRGKAGAAEVEVNVIGREVRELGRRDAVEGRRVTLTIDGEIQRYAQEILAREKSASCVVMDAHTGAVYAMASHPSFDPNLFVRGMPSDVYQELLANEGIPLTNKAIAGQYPPGSTFKMVTGLAALAAGAIDRNTSVFCPGYFDYGGNKFHCWKHGGHGRVNLRSALMGSCDTYFYKISLDTGIDKIAAMARKLGLGELLDFELNEERPGLIPDRAWKKGKLGEVWHNGETVVNAIGQGYMLATPLQLAVMTARIVNGGKAVKPTLAGFVGALGRVQDNPASLDIPERHLSLVMEGMNDVVNNLRGTAYGSRIKEPGMEMAGKTGTAQVRRITKEQRAQGVKNEDLPWKQRHHALFVGYAPVDNPKYVCCVVVEHGVGGSSAAAPLAKDLLLKTQMRNPAATLMQPEKGADENIVMPGFKPLVLDRGE